MPMNPNIAAKLGHWKTFELSAGCWCLAEDSRGCLWIGTHHSGVARYDGKEFKRFSMPEGLSAMSVYCLLEDRAGNMMVGTGSGLSIIKGEECIESPLTEHLKHMHVSTLCYDSRGRLWISAAGRVFRCEGQCIAEGFPQISVPGTMFWSFCCDRTGVLWAASDKCLLRLCEDDAPEVIETGIQSDIMNIAEGPDNSLLIAAVDGVYRYSEGSVMPIPAFIGKRTPSIIVDAEKNIWAVHLNPDHVSCFDGEHCVLFDANDVLAARSVSQVIADRDGGFWFACLYGGITRYDPCGISTISSDCVEETAQGFNNDRMYWSGAPRTLTCYKEGVAPKTTRDTQPDRTQLVENPVFCDSKGRLWLNGAGMIHRFNSLDDYEAGRFEKLSPTDMRTDDWAWCFCEDTQGTVWVGTRRGLFRFSGSATSRVYEVEAPEYMNGVRAVLIDNRDASVWIASEFRGIGHYRDGSFTWYTEEQGLCDIGVLCLTQDRTGTIWYGTQSGVGCFDGRTFRTMSGAGGIDIDFTHRLLVDSSDHIWMGTIGRGVCRFDGRNFQFLTTADGLPSNNVTGIMQTSNGNLFFATYKGVCRYPRHRLAPPLIGITAVDADQPYVNPTQVRLTTAASHVRIRYRGVSFGTPRLRYRYRLEGIDHVWNQTWNEEAIYRDLPEGEFVFHVAAVNRDLAVSDPPATLRIIVEADPRNRVISELESKVRERTRELEAANNDLADVNTELNDFAHAVSHDLKAPLRAVTSLVEWISEDHRDALGEAGREKLRLLAGKTDRMRALIDGILRYSRLGKAAQEKELVDTRVLAHDIIELLAPPQHVTVSMHGVFPTLGCNRIRMSEVFQNLLSNAVRYGDSLHSQVEIACARDGEYWRFSVTDNGPGIDKRYHEKIFRMFETVAPTADTESTGVGLAIVKKIVTLMGGTIRVESEPGHGASFIFTIPAV